MSEPDLPRDPAEHRPKPLMGWTFWVMLAFGFLCVLAGAGVAMLLPRLLPPKPSAALHVVPAPRDASPGAPFVYADARFVAEPLPYLVHADYSEPERLPRALKSQ